MKRLLKSILGLTLIVTLIALVDWRLLLSHLRGVNLHIALFAFAGYGLQFFTSGWKWGLALRLLNERMPKSYLVRVYCISHFMGQFLPSQIGGDAYRIYRTMKLSQSRTRPITAIVVERVTGLLALLGLGCLAAISLSTKFVIAKTYLFLLSIVFLIGIGLFAALRWRLFAFINAKLQRRAWFLAVANDCRQLLVAGRLWISFLALSLLFQMIAIFIVYLLFVSMGSSATLIQTTFIVAIAGLVSILPISINGLGVTEGSIVGAAVALGLNAEEALSVGMLSRLLVFPLTLACGVLYLGEASPTRADAKTYIQVDSLGRH